jgi:hypothetical protein
MLVAVLRQYLLSLVPPLRAGGAAAKVVADLEDAAGRLERFKDYKVDQLAEFLAAAEDFKLRGLLPEPPGAKKRAAAVKPIDRVKVDSASQVLRDLAARAAADGEAAHESVAPEIAKLEGELSKDEAAVLARLFEIVKPFRTAKAALKEIRGKLFPAPPKQAKAARGVDPARVRELAQTVARLSELALDAERRPEVEGGVAALKKPGVLSKDLALAVAREVGVVTNSRMSRDEALRQIERQVFAPAATLESIRQ